MRGEKERHRMTQLRAVAIAAFFLGIGLAGEPLSPQHALLAAAILALVAVALEASATALIVFLSAVAAVLVTCYVQHGEIYPGSGIVAIGLGGLAASSMGRPWAPALIAVLGTAVGTALFFLL